LRYFPSVALVTLTAVLGAGPALAESPTPMQEATTLEDGGGLLGKEVRSSADEALGRIIDVVVDRFGVPRAVLIDFGGFLGVGSRKIAVAWGLMSFGGPEDDRIKIQTTRDRLNGAPEFREGKPIIILGAENATTLDSNRVQVSER
jgi:hypothetical protein